MVCAVAHLERGHHAQVAWSVADLARPFAKGEATFQQMDGQFLARDAQQVERDRCRHGRGAVEDRACKAHLRQDGKVLHELACRAAQLAQALLLGLGMEQRKVLAQGGHDLLAIRQVAILRQPEASRSAAPRLEGVIDRQFRHQAPGLDGQAGTDVMRTHGDRGSRFRRSARA